MPSAGIGNDPEAVGEGRRKIVEYVGIVAVTMNENKCRA